MCVLKQILSISAVVIILANFDSTSGHGMVMDPVARASRWRVDTTAKINYNDNGNFCGGYYVRRI